MSIQVEEDSAGNSVGTSPAVAVTSFSSSVAARVDHGQQCIRLVVADDQRLFRESIVGILNAEASLEVVASASNGLEAVEMTRHWQPGSAAAWSPASRPSPRSRSRRPGRPWVTAG